MSYIKTRGRWICFDDTVVSRAGAADLAATFGKASDWAFGNDTHAYILFYQLPECEGSARGGGAAEDVAATTSVLQAMETDALVATSANAIDTDPLVKRSGAMTQDAFATRLMGM